MTRISRPRLDPDPPPKKGAKPTAEPLRRKKYMKRTSTKQAKLYRDVKGWRAAFVASVKCCQVCSKTFRWKAASPEMMDAGTLFVRTLSVHEIAKGPVKGVAMKHRACCLVVCSKCNCDDLCDYSQWPIERQLALKLITDPEYFDLDLFNKVRGRAPTAVTLANLQPYLQLK